MEFNRLKWGCRRGMLELDLILLPFLENVYLTLPESEQNLFHDLLVEEDQDLFAWLMNRSDPDNPNTLQIVQIIRDNTGLKV